MSISDEWMNELTATGNSLTSFLLLNKVGLTVPYVNTDKTVVILEVVL